MNTLISFHFIPSLSSLFLVLFIQIWLTKRHLIDAYCIKMVSKGIFYYGNIKKKTSYKPKPMSLVCKEEEEDDDAFRNSIHYI